jgi:hypothetical protein
MALVQSKPSTFLVTKKSLNGIITNDKFCHTRFISIPLSHSRRPLRSRIEDLTLSAYPSDEATLNKFLSGGDKFGGKNQNKLSTSRETTSGRKTRCAKSLGKSLSEPSVLDCSQNYFRATLSGGRSK